MGQVAEADLHESRLRAHRLALRMPVGDDREDKRSHRALLAGHLRRVEEPDEVHVPVVFHEVQLAASVQCEDLGPDEDEDLPKIRRRRLQQLEDVRENSHGEREVDSPRSHVEEPPEQHQGAEPVRLREEHLKHDGQLLGRGFTLRAVLQPNLERRELFGEKRARRKLDVRVPGDKRRQLEQANLHRHVPRVPHGVLVRGWQCRAGYGRAVVRAHDPLGE
mmetsp:Transcript_11371/g.47595  ORF Transcript_11371/g.47595 Transcript_11371/m.47595 type:complete len:220 (-) Transcript_11371:405-1064(-)